MTMSKHLFNKRQLKATTMGYTHYWKLKERNPKKFKEAVELFKTCWDKVNSLYSSTGRDVPELYDGAGRTPSPIISDTCLCFNGKGELAHETFGIEVGDSDSDFCKTAGKPYDLAVCLALLSFKEIFGEGFEYDTDGVNRETIKDEENIKYWKSINYTPEINEEWKRAYEIWDTI